ncbi:MAG: isoleucine--tRNA ligase [Phycisphaerae bacterium]|jgi:isoleucyl-tRNA synthetase
MFEPLPSKFDFPQAERNVLEFWEKNGVFEQSLRLRESAPRFVFFEGPPTANGLPHPGHCLTRAIKDLFPRYRTMCGYLVERKAGWDTHGLPVEVEVCKELGIHGKDEIEAYGVEKFNLRCIQSVFRYTREWEEMTRRLGFWVNLQDAYVTFHKSYVESVWWSLKTLFERGLLYQGHKVVWWWAQGGTALSSGEVGEGYRTVDDPSVFVKFPVVKSSVVQTSGLPPAVAQTSRSPRAEAQTSGSQPAAEAASGFQEQSGALLYESGALLYESGAMPCGAWRDRVSLLVWTTTPWTLVSNHFVAVHPDLEYALVEDPGPEGGQPEYLYIAKDLVESVAKKVKRELRVVSTCKGADLVGLQYLPPFSDAYYDRPWARFGDHSASGRRAHVRLSQANDAAQFTHEVEAPLRAGGQESVGWRVLAADFVTIESGTGLVHEAPAFGEVDFNLLQEERKRFEDPGAIPLLNAVNPDGTFNDDAPERYRGRWVKDCDKEIIRELRDERKTRWGTPLLYHQEVYRHEYPFCPRAENDPLIQYARKSWFVRTSQFKDEFLKNNAVIHWLPEHIKEGRFGDFLRNNVDWALSRERYWGTPLPIWQCEKCGRMEAIGSFAELQSKPGATDATDEYPQGYWKAKVAEHAAEGETLPDHLRVHKPYIDAWTYECGCSATTLRSHESAEGSTPAAAGGAQSRAQARKPADQTVAGVRPARMRRVPEVIDCWWDAGSMPFAQWGFPHAPGSEEMLAQRFPADFISEAIDQTRGWFYGLLAISTLLFAGPVDSFTTAPPCRDRSGPDAPIGRYPLPFRTCIVLGHMMGEDGLKMSKRKKNYREPSYVFDHYGADAMRWYFFSAQTPWTSVRFQEAAIRDTQREFLVKLYNVLSFFNIYANIDGFEASFRLPVKSGESQDRSVPTSELATRSAQTATPRGAGWRPPAQRGELDRWILSELHRTIRAVRESMDRFENYPAAQRLSDFVEALSNWYVRRSRERFWRAVNAAGNGNQDKWDAYHTLYECLLTLSMLIAPFTPFFAETMYQNLTGIRNQGSEIGERQTSQPAVAGSTLLDPPSPSPISVHLCDYPVADPALIDEELAAEMDVVREIVSLGRAARTDAKLKVRQPLARVEIILARREHEHWLQSHAALIAEELNVKRVDFTAEADHYVTYQVKPNFKAIGPKFGKLAPKIAAVLGKLPDAASARRTLADTGALSLDVDGQPVTLSPDEVEIRLEPREGWSAAQGRVGVVVVSTAISPELREEALIRELIHHVQAARKEQDLAYESRIAVSLAAEPVFAEVVRKFESLLRTECLADTIEYAPAPPGDATDLTIEGHAVQLRVRRR